MSTTYNPIATSASSEPTSYKGEPIGLGGLQHEHAYTPQGAVDPSLLSAYMKAGSAILLSVFPLKRYSVLPYAGQMMIEIPPAAKDRVFIRKMEPRRMASPVQDTSLPLWEDEVREVSRGEGYVALRVTDTFQWVLDIHHRGDKHHYVPMAISAKSVAEALAEDWVRGLATQTGRAGIGVYDPQGPPMAEQARELRRVQEQAFIEKVRQADISSAANRQSEITDFHRVAAEWLGIERPWFKPILEVITKDCPGCAEKMPEKAKRCRICQLDLVEWYLRQYKDPEQVRMKDPVIYEHLVETGKYTRPKA